MHELPELSVVDLFLHVYPTSLWIYVFLSA